jgi:GNAT superfamily N-acetyltransferase
MPTVDPPAGGDPPVRIRPATEDDVPAIDRLVRELAAYEREPDAVTAVPDDFRAALFGPQPLVHCLVAQGDGTDVAGRPEIAGFAVWFVTFSTWTGQHGIWLEDLFVAPEHRGGGTGRALLQRLAELAVERGYRRLEWNVLDWNEPALGFYRRLGAEALDTWTVHRLSGDALHRLAFGGTRRGVPPPPERA